MHLKKCHKLLNHLVYRQMKLNLFQPNVWVVSCLQRMQEEVNLYMNTCIAVYRNVFAYSEVNQTKAKTQLNTQWVELKFNSRQMWMQLAFTKNVHCSKKLKEHFENTSDLSGEEYHAGYLYWHGLGNLLGTKGWHMVWWKWKLSIYRGLN